MIRQAARAVLNHIRDLNRRWIDRVDPDWPPAPASPEVASPAPTASPVAGDVWVVIEGTPNPDAVKFTANRTITDTPTTWLTGSRPEHPVGQTLLALPGVRSVFAVDDFVTVTRESGVDWSMLEPAIESALVAALTHR